MFIGQYLGIFNMQNSDLEVIIVGGGLVGSTLACALLQGGMRVGLVEAQSKPFPISTSSRGEKEAIDLRTFALTRASERIFTNLGVWDRIIAQRVSFFREMHVWDASGSGEIHFDSAMLHEPALGYIVEHSVIQAALNARLSEFETLSRYQPAKVQRFNLITNETAMQVELDDGQCLTTRLLIGAEGAHSSIRTLAGISYKLLDHGQQALVATVQTALPHQETAWQRFLPTGPLAFLPLSDSYTSSIVWSIDTPLAQQLMALEKKAFQQELEEAFAFKLGEVKESSQRVTFPLQSRYVLNYVQPRLALVGDAAHTILPLAGQGLNLGLLDAAALSEVILNAYVAQRDFGSYRELRRYERWREGNNFMMLKTMEGFKYLFGKRSSLVIGLRNIGLSFTDAVSPLKKLIMPRAMGITGDLPRLARYPYGDG